MKELETIKRVLKSLTSEEQIALHNATLDMDCMNYEIHKMEEFDDVINDFCIGALELIGELGTQYKFDASDKYFMFVNGDTTSASDIKSFNDYFKEEKSALDGLANYLLEDLNDYESAVVSLIKEMVKGAWKIMKYQYLIRCSDDGEIEYNLKDAIDLAKRYSQNGVATIERTKILNKQSYYDTNYLRVFLFGKELKGKYTWEDFPQIFKSQN